MCGIAGVVSLQPDAGLESVVQEMNGTLCHRGPDGHGMYVCPTGCAALGHRRLAIIDLKTGDQPMSDHSGTRTIVFNGEIYNYRELRANELASTYPFATESDTEVILAAHARWGDDMPSHLRGMFAFALWDAAQRSLLVSRDRFGEKPLFYTQRDNRLYFASELKAIQRVISLQVDRVALTQYLVLGYVPGERTIYQGVHRLRPGHSLRLDANGTTTGEAYWSLPAPDDRESERPVADWEERIALELEQSVRMRMISDVPLGAFLSGGLDSSTIVALCLRNVSGPFHTFSIRPRDTYSPDADAALNVSALLGTVHHEEILDCPTPDEMIALFRHFDEPFADSSMIPTSSVSRAARQQVTVSLSGDGGDEMFGGYGVYRDYRALSDLAHWPGASFAAGVVEHVLPRGAPGAASLGVLAADPGRRYLRLVSHLWNGPLLQVLGGDSATVEHALAELTDLFRFPGTTVKPGPVARAQWVDAARGYLNGDILHKVDMAAMLHSLEVRPPFLDHVLAETLSTLPASLRMPGGRGKLLLRRIARRFLPEEIIERRKVGFTVPLGKWLEGPLRALVDDYVCGATSPLAAYIDIRAAQRLASSSGPAQRSWLLFSLLSLGVWAETVANPRGR